MQAILNIGVEQEGYFRNMETNKTPGKLSLSRRQFIKGAGTLAVAGAATMVGFNLNKNTVKAADDLMRESADHQWVLVFDLRYCDGCKTCTTACQKEHYLPVEAEWLKVYELEGPLGQKYFMPKPCMQCENAPCVRVCPVKATYKTKDGITLVDQQKCIGCRMCMAACPYDSRYFNWKDYPPVPSTLAKPTPEFPVPGVKGTVGKCEMCLHLMRFGKLPECVRQCSMRAAWAGDLISDICSNPDESKKLSTFLKDNDAYRLKEELNTGPRVYYIAGHSQNYSQ
jgi:molybdopterin-containing oxidoreductase family iron-sulfur binding subunit